MAGSAQRKVHLQRLLPEGIATHPKWVADTTMLRNRRAFIIKAALLNSLQQNVKNDQMSLDQMYLEIIQSMKEASVPKNG